MDLIIDEISNFCEVLSRGLVRRTADGTERLKRGLALYCKLQSSL